MFTVTIREAKGLGGQQWSSQHEAGSESEAVCAAIREHFGERAGFTRDHSLPGSRRFGQVTVRVSNNPETYSCVTGRVYIDVARVQEGG
jgi:hypothetical protein